MLFATRATGSLFARIAEAPSLDRQAVVAPEGALTWAELLDRAQRLAGSLGTEPSPVLVYGHKQPAMVVAILAALRLGRPYIPVDLSAPPARIARMLEAARPTDAVFAHLHLLDQGTHDFPARWPIGVLQSCFHTLGKHLDVLDHNLQVRTFPFRFA